MSKRSTMKYRLRPPPQHPIKFAVGAAEKPKFIHPVWSRVDVYVGYLTSQDSQESWVSVCSNIHFRHSPLTPVELSGNYKLILTLGVSLKHVQDESGDKGHTSSTNMAWVSKFPRCYVLPCFFPSPWLSDG